MASRDGRPSFWRLMFRGFTRRCPLCGCFRIFDSYFHIKQRCPRCDYPLKRVEGQEVGAVGVNTIVTFGLMLIAIVVGMVVTYPDIPAIPLAVVAMAIALVVPIAFYPLSWTVWNAVDLFMRPVEASDRVKQEWVPSSRRGRHPA
ncbi:MAG TPA: DUF983 domain-containing protein [Acidimicrobiales bacterium]|jgi:uncharacterized protein (DUF983 family)